MNKNLCHLLVSCIALSALALAQSTQGLIRGQVRGSRGSGGAFYVMYCRLDGNGVTAAKGSTKTDDRGYYAIPFLTPGSYRLRAQREVPDKIAEGDCFPPPGDGKEFRAQEKHDLTLPVAGSLVVDFELRERQELLLRDRYSTQQGMVVRYFAADARAMKSIQIDTSAAGAEAGGSSLSYVIDPRQIETLPFTGQDVFAALVMQPGVTADSATGRGLGLSVNGQRVSSSQFLLDGVAYNDDLLTGPASQLSPESVQEYRISTNNFSAESGGASGYVANAVTRSGGTSFHGALFGRLGEQWLAGRSFERRYMGAGRGTDRERRTGFRLGGPAWRQKIFYSASYEAFSTRRDAAPEPYSVLSQERIGACVPGLNDQSKLLLAVRSRGAVAGSAQGNPGDCSALRIGRDPEQAVQDQLQKDMVDPFTMVPSAKTANRLLVARVDVPLSRGWHFMARAVSAAASRPEFVPSLYTGFSPDLAQPSNDVAALFTIPALRNRFVQEVRLAGLSREFAWNRPAPAGISEILPGMVSPSRGLPFIQVGAAPLAGSPASYEFDYRQNSGFLSHHGVLNTASHVLSFGGDSAFRSSRLYLPYLKSGVVSFSDVWRFISPPEGFSAVSVDRESQWNRIVSRRVFSSDVSNQLLGLPMPVYHTHSSARQYGAYFQDSWRVHQRLTIQYGVRFEYFGFPRDEGRQKGYLVPGPGVTIAEQVKAATPSWNADLAREIGGSGIWEGRFGVAYRLDTSGNVVTRVAYGTYADRLFENLVQTLRNNIGVVGMAARRIGGPPPCNVLSARAIPSIDDQLACGQVRNIRDLPFLWLDPKMRAPQVHNWVGGLDWRVRRGLMLSANSMGSKGSRLITSDLLNRVVNPNPPSTSPSAPTDALGPIVYRSNSGDSTFAAMAFRMEYQAKAAFLQLSYTVSRAIDVQSDALRGDFFDLTRTTWGGLVDRERSYSQLQPNPLRAQFTRPLDPNGDRGPSDFNQRHNFVVYAALEIPTVAKSRRWVRYTASGWRLSKMIGIRSGFPFTPVDVNGYRLSARGAGPLIVRQAGWSSHVGYLNPDAFQVSDVMAEMPNLGRNVLEGPGFWNVDAALCRSFSVGERPRLEFRADVFNLFNHANLGRPNVVWSSSDTATMPDSTFGGATYGRAGFSSNFPGILPLFESARRIQLVVRFSF